MFERLKPEELIKKLERADAALATARETAKREAETLEDTALTLGSAFGLGFVEGRYGEQKVANVPVRWGAFIAGRIAAAYEGASALADRLRAAANGIGAYSAGLEGLRMGTEAAKAAANAPKALPTAAPPAPPGLPVPAK